MQNMFSDEQKSMIERLDNLMPVDDRTNQSASDTKFAYDYVDGEIEKFAVPLNYHYKSGQTNSLTQALIELSNLTGTPAAVIAEGMLFDLESEEEESKSQLDKELDDAVVDRLEGLLKNLNNASSPSSVTKIIYKFIDGKPYRVKVDAHYECKDNGTENKSLRRLLELQAGSSMPWSILAEDILEQIEMNDNYYPKEKPAPVQAKYGMCDDLRGREVYIQADRRNNWVKVRIESFAFYFPSNGAEPMYTDIEIRYSDGTTGTINDKDELLFTKEAVIQRLTDYVNSL